MSYYIALFFNLVCLNLEYWFLKKLQFQPLEITILQNLFTAYKVISRHWLVSSWEGRTWRWTCRRPCRSWWWPRWRAPCPPSSRPGWRCAGASWARRGTPWLAGPAWTARRPAPHSRPACGSTRSRCQTHPGKINTKWNMKEGKVLFNEKLNTFYLWLYGIRHMVKDQFFGHH